MPLFTKFVIVSAFAMMIASVPQSESIDFGELSQLFEESKSNTTSEPFPETEFTESSTPSQLPESEPTNLNDHPKITPKSLAPPKSSEEPPLPLPDKDLDWEQIRKKNFLYIDKTPYLIKLLEKNTKLCFLTRPRRFGKTMFVDMMNGFFHGEKDLFEGLAIGKEGNTKYFAENLPKTEGKLLPKWMEFPVIHLNFAKMGLFKTEEVFDVKFRGKLEDIATFYKIDISRRSNFDLSNLIEALYDKFNKTNVIVLIDEYDYPFHYAFQTLKNRDLAKYVLDFLDSISTVIKSNVKEIGLAYVTGVYKLGSSTSESDVICNPLIDLTFDKDLAGAFGYSESEIKENLGPHMIKFARNISTTQNAENTSDDPSLLEDEIFNQLKFWYDGYQFAEKNDACRVFHPISTLQCLKNQKFPEKYRTSTRTASIENLVERFYADNRYLGEFRKGISIFRENLHKKLNPLTTKPPYHIQMLLSGYLTISSYNKESDKVTLTLPNNETAEIFEHNLASYGFFRKSDPNGKLFWIN